VSLRRLLPFLMLVALATAPFGRMAAAEAKAMPHPGTMTMAGHCAGQPQPDQDHHSGPGSIDCMIACAAMAPATAPDFVPPVQALTEPVAPSAVILAGIRPEAEPPPPRFS